jgi:hypothetical protein
MTAEIAKRIARNYVKDELAVLELAKEFLKANEAGYKECSNDFNEAWDRITAGKPRSK